MAEMNHLEMSDEDFLNAPMPEASEQQPNTESSAQNEEQQNAGDNPGTATEQDPSKEEGQGEGESQEEEENKGGNEEDPQGSAQGSDAAAGDKPASKEETGAKPVAKEGTEATGKETPAAGSETPFDYKAAYEKLTGSFKANGRDFKVNSVDDAIQLMQMGVGFNKKMAALKPHLKLIKTLEQNGLLSEEQINNFIDLQKKNPAAIAKLVKDSGINPMDIDTEKPIEYKPGNYSISDKELDLDQVLDEIQSSPAYGRTLQVINKEWDNKSKQFLADTPALIKVVNDHMGNGVYDVIAAELDRERVLGRLSGLSDIEAYRQVGDAIHARGGFNHLFTSGQAGNQPGKEVVQPKPQQEDEGKRNEMRRAASGAKQTVAGGSKKKDFNPLEMSDAEFEKLVQKQYL